ncbi:MAG: Cellulophaga phage phiSM [Candidatus Parcubacteria bacterium]|jgi:peptidoglycan L-alanyl-D-glutamate endopeptidase CwlK
MRDQVTLDRIKLLHPKLRDEAVLLYDEICKNLTGKAICRFAYTHRTFAEQDALYAQGRTKKGAKVTNAKGGQSYHNYGLAIDIVLLVDTDGNGSFETASWDSKTDFDRDSKADWQEVVAIFKRYGYEWGGDWKFVDAPHFQKTFGKSIVDLQALHNSDKVDKNGFVLI